MPMERLGSLVHVVNPIVSPRGRRSRQPPETSTVNSVSL
jgi:hypothetical protein